MSTTTAPETKITIDQEKERMLAIADALATAAGAARAVVRQITRIELLEASDTGDEQILAARGQLGTLRQRYREAQRVAEAILEGEIPHGISSMGVAFDNRGVRASVAG